MDWIALKALEKEPGRRYESANAFALDILRYLRSQPVSARAPTASYRFKKFITRHRGPVVAVSAIVITLGGAAMLAYWLADSRAQKGQAEKEVKSQRDSIRTAKQQTDAERARANDAARNADIATKTAEAEKAAAAEAQRRLGLAAEEARKQRERVQEQTRTASSADFASSQQAFAKGDWQTGMAFLGRSLRHSIDNRRAQQALWLALACGQSNAPPIPQSRWVVSGSYEVKAISPDGSRVLLVANRSSMEVGPDRKLRPMKTGPPEVRDSRSGRLVASLDLSGDVGLDRPAFSPDGQRIVARTYEGPSNVFTHKALLFNASTGVLLGEIPCDQMVVFSPDSKRLVTDATQATVSIWDANNSGKLIDLGDGTGWIDRALSAQFGPDGRHIAVIFEGGSLAVWDTTTKKSIYKHPGKGTIPEYPNFSRPFGQLVQFSPDGKRLLTLRPVIAGMSATPVDKSNPRGEQFLNFLTASKAELLNALDGKPIARFDNDALHAAFTPDGSKLLVTSVKRCSIFDADTGNLREHGESPTGSFLISPDGRCLLASGKVWEIESQVPLGPQYFPAETLAQFAAEGETLLASLGRSVCSFAVRVPRTSGFPLPHRRASVYASFSPDSKRVVTATTAEAGIDIPDAQDTSATAQTRSMSMVGRTVSDQAPPARVKREWIDLDAIIWDANSGVRLASIPACWTRAVVDRTATLVTAFGSFIVTQFSPDCRSIVTTSKGNEATIWDISTKSARATLRGHAENIFAARFSPDGERVLTIAGDRTIRVWNATTGQPVTPRLLHTGFLVDATFNSDGTRILSESESESNGERDTDNFGMGCRQRETGLPSNAGNRIEVQPGQLSTGLGKRAPPCRLGFFGTEFQIFEAVDDREVFKSQSLREFGIGPPLVGRFGAPRALDAQAESRVITGLPVVGLRGSVTSDFTRCVTAGESSLARVWDINTTQTLPDGAFAEKLVSFAGGAVLDQTSGALRPLDHEKRLELYAEMKPVLERNDLSDWRLMVERIREQRPEAPWSIGGNATVRDVCMNLIMSGQKEHLVEAYGNDPGNPLIHFALSRFETSPKAASFLKEFSRKRVIQLPLGEQATVRALATRLMARLP